jgi:hypothetical protein
VRVKVRVGQWLLVALAALLLTSGLMPRRHARWPASVLRQADCRRRGAIEMSTTTIREPRVSRAARLMEQEIQKTILRLRELTRQQLAVVGRRKKGIGSK